VRDEPIADSRTFWDKAAPGYAKSPIKDEASYEKTLVRTRAHFSRDDDVLELGCGTGTTALKLADDARHILATDISAKMIEIAQAKARDQSIANVEFVTATADDRDLDGRTFDAVLAFNVLHLLDDLDATLRRIAVLVRPGGLFISKTVCLAGQRWYMKPMVSVMQAFGKAPYVRFLGLDELDQAIASAGFDIIETADDPGKLPRRFIVARRR